MPLLYGSPGSTLSGKPPAALRMLRCPGREKRAKEERRRDTLHEEEADIPIGSFGLWSFRCFSPFFYSSEERLLRKQRLRQQQL